MEETSVGNRVIVLGSAGSGKSTLAKELHRRTGLPLFHLDNIWWKADRTHITREEFDERLNGILQGDRWIVDGDYSRTYEPRFRACDTVIFLDFPVEDCMNGIQDRVGKARTDIPWVESELDPELVDLVVRYPEERRPAVYGLIEKYPEKKVLIFKNREEVREWLSGIGNGAV